MALWHEPAMSPHDEEMVSAFMRQLAAEGLPVAPHFERADVVWWKAQLVRRWDAERRATAPLDLMEPLQMVAAAGTAAFLLLWALPSLLRVLTL